MAFLLAIEGADGAGKGTVAAATVALLGQQGVGAASLSFPRYTETVAGHVIGEFLGKRLPHPVTPYAAATLYALDRFESRGAVAALAQAHDVIVLDRYIASNMAYQATTGDLDDAAETMRWIAALETGHFALPKPGLNVYLDTPGPVARERIALKQRRSYTEAAYDFYEADDALQARVRDNYRAMTAGDLIGPWVSVTTTDGDASRAPADIAADVVAAWRAATPQSLT